MQDFQKPKKSRSLGKVTCCGSVDLFCIGDHEKTGSIVNCRKAAFRYQKILFDGDKVNCEGRDYDLQNTAVTQPHHERLSREASDQSTPRSERGHY